MYPSLDKQNAIWAISAMLVGTNGDDFKTTSDYLSMEEVCEIANKRIFGYVLDSTLLGHAVANVYAANREGTYKLLLENFMRENNVYRNKKDLIQTKYKANLSSWGTEYKQLTNAPKICLFGASFKNSVAAKKLVGNRVRATLSRISLVGNEIMNFLGYTFDFGGVAPPTSANLYCTSRRYDTKRTLESLSRNSKEERIDDLINFAKQQLAQPTDVISLLGAAILKETKDIGGSQDEDYHDVLGDHKSAFMGHRDLALSQRWRRPNLTNVEKENIHDVYAVAKLVTEEGWQAAELVAR